MAAFLKEAILADQDIDPNSTLVIRACIQSIAQNRANPTSSQTAPAPGRDTGEITSSQLLAEHTASQSKAETGIVDLSLDRVLTMSPSELEALHKRVQQLQLSNYGLLRRVYGSQVSVAPSTYLKEHNFSPEAGMKSESHRSALHEQYRSMMDIARDPKLLGLEPASTEGARLLEHYLAQQASLTSPPVSPVERQSASSNHRDLGSKARQKHSYHASRVDKKANQEYKAQFVCWNTGIRPQNTALTDYQMQLMLLEEQNQNRLAMMRSQQQASPTSPAGFTEYEAQLRTLKFMNEKRLQLRTRTLSDAPPKRVNRDEAMTVDGQIREGEEADHEMAQSPRGRRRAVKLPMRNRRVR